MICLVSENELSKLALELSSKLKSGDLIILNGELGAGKTTFVKYLAEGLKIDKNITSPTYSIIKEYDDILCHIDAYRIYSENIDVDYYIDKGYIICIEWSENIKDYIPYINYIINIDYTENPDKREIEIISKKNDNF